MLFTSHGCIFWTDIFGIYTWLLYFLQHGKWKQCISAVHVYDLNGSLPTRINLTDTKLVKWLVCYNICIRQEVHASSNIHSILFDQTGKFVNLFILQVVWNLSSTIYIIQEYAGVASPNRLIAVSHCSNCIKSSHNKNRTSPCYCISCRIATWLS